ncbi:DASH complex subunit Spc34-domain-containing protein [Usnea florida]
MTLLDNHLEQISLSSAAIAELPFPSSKIFTNALLHSHDITALIRDTEAHERALFTLAEPDRGSYPSAANVARRSTVHGLNGAGDTYGNGNGLLRGQRPRSAVATLLGGEYGEQMRKDGAKERGQVDVELLLKGAEKLCSVFPIDGAPEKIVSLRSRYEQLNSSIARYESKVSRQMAQLARMNKRKDGDVDDDDDDTEMLEDEDVNAIEGQGETHVTEEDIRRENDDIRELEKKKQQLEERVKEMERDLGGLRR